jgi:hypothetical protein
MKHCGPQLVGRAAVENWPWTVVVANSNSSGLALYESRLPSGEDGGSSAAATSLSCEATAHSRSGAYRSARRVASGGLRKLMASRL